MIGSLQRRLIKETRSWIPISSLHSRILWRGRFLGIMRSRRLQGVSLMVRQHGLKSARTGALLHEWLQMGLSLGGLPIKEYQIYRELLHTLAMSADPCSILGEDGWWEPMLADLNYES